MTYILLIEDNPANADLTMRILTTAGYTVKHTLRGFAGAQLARRERPVLILMDFNLPDIDGQTLTLLLKKQLGGHQAPPIVAVTARTGEAEARLAAQFGCSGFIGKPFLPQDLLTIVERLLSVSPTTYSKHQNEPVNESE